MSLLTEVSVYCLVCTIRQHRPRAHYRAALQESSRVISYQLQQEHTLTDSHTPPHSFIKPDYFTGCHGNLLTQYNILQQPNRDIHLLLCTANLSFYCFEAVFRGQNQMTNVRCSGCCLGLFYFSKGKSNINVKILHKSKPDHIQLRIKTWRQLLNLFQTSGPPSPYFATRSKSHVEHCSLQVKAQAERLPETRALGANEAPNKNSTTLNSSRETDALETILKTSSSASAQSRNKFWSTNYP